MLFGAGLSNLIDAFWKSDGVVMEARLLFVCFCFASILALDGILGYLSISSGRQEPSTPNRWAQCCLFWRWRRPELPSFATSLPAAHLPPPWRSCPMVWKPLTQIQIFPVIWKTEAHKGKGLLQVQFQSGWEEGIRTWTPGSCSWSEASSCHEGAAPSAVVRRGGLLLASHLILFRWEPSDPELWETVVNGTWAQLAFFHPSPHSAATLPSLPSSPRVT